jgi:hypothetical protein
MLGLALLWFLVITIELNDISNTGLGVLIVPPGELAAWLGAIALTVYAVRRLLRGWVSVAAAVVGLVACVYMTNWGVFEPRSYFATHQWAFGHVASLADDGELDSDEYLGAPLPRYVADLSTNGRVAVIGDQDGQPVYFLPQYMGLRSRAAGYVYFDGVPEPGLVIDLFGHREYLTAGLDLGDGWWYIKPGDSEAPP